MAFKSRKWHFLRSRLLYHSIFWGFIFLFVFFASRAASATWNFSFTLALSLVIFMPIPVYLHFFFLERFFNQKRYFFYSVSVVGIITGFAPLFTLYFSSVFGTKNNVVQWMTDLFFALLVTTAIKFVKHGFEQRLLVDKIKAKQLQTELGLLKSQINPHFLFNTLNNLYSMALEHQDQNMADSISRLSRLMRYTIHESNQEAIGLEKEIQQIQSYIDLQKLRFTEEDNIHVHFIIQGNRKGKTIPPMLLIPFVENAFKHGISTQFPSTIDIRLNVQDESLQFEVENTLHSMNPDKKNEESGLGLTNIQRRLDLLYPKTHALHISKDTDRFKIRLQIPL